MIRRITKLGRRIALGAIVASLISASMVGAFAVTLHYVAPARNLAASSPQYRPIIEDGWIKLPFDIVRTKECLAQSTITLRRAHDYGPDLGKREDVVVIGLFNTTITGLGIQRVMLWFRQPPHLGSGAWNYDSKIQDDCGGIGDLLNFSADRPRLNTIPNVLVIPPEGAP